MNNDTDTAAWVEFKSGFRRAERGALFRKWDGARLYIVLRGEGYRWKIVYPGETETTSMMAYATENEAITSVGEWLDVGY